MVFLCDIVYDILTQACRRNRATCPAKTVAQLRYTRRNVPITGLTDKLTRMGQIEGLFNRLPVAGAKFFRNIHASSASPNFSLLIRYLSMLAPTFFTAFGDVCSPFSYSLG